MKYKIFVTPQFKKDIKYYRKKKKYLKITDDLDEVFSELETGNFIGDEVPGLKLGENEKENISSNIIIELINKYC